MRRGGAVKSLDAALCTNAFLRVGRLRVGGGLTSLFFQLLSKEFEEENLPFPPTLPRL